MHTTSVRFAVLATTIVACAASASPLQRVAVYDLNAVDVDARTAAVCTEAIASEARKYEGLAVLGLSDVRALVEHESNRQMLGCDSTSCATELGGALGVDIMIVGQIGRIGESDVVTVRRVKVRDGTIEQGATKAVPRADGQAFLSVVGPLVAELFLERALRPGAVAGVDPEYVALLRPPPLPTWVTFGTAGVAGAALLGSGVAYVLAGVSNLQWQAQIAAGQAANQYDGAAMSPLRQQGLAQENVAGVLLGTALTLALGVGVESLFTDWDGYAAWKPGRPAPVQP